MPLKRQKRKTCLFSYLCTDARYRKESGRNDGVNVHAQLDPRGAGPPEAVPGSEQKISLMEDRVSKGYLPFHPDDPTCLYFSEEIAAALTIQPPHARSEPEWSERNGNGHEHNGDDEGQGEED